MFGLFFIVPFAVRLTCRRGQRRAAPAILVGLCLALSTWTLVAARAETVLIRPDEAALPPAPPTTAVKIITRGIVRRPRIVLVAPETSVHSPFNLKFVFRPIGGSVIEPGSVRLVYVKREPIDLTKRVVGDITGNGIDVVGAVAPPGDHTVRVTVEDSLGRKASAVFVLHVRK